MSSPREDQFLLAQNLEPHLPNPVKCKTSEESFKSCINIIMSPICISNGNKTWMFTEFNRKKSKFYWWDDLCKNNHRANYDQWCLAKLRSLSSIVQNLCNTMEPQLPSLQAHNFTPTSLTSKDLSVSPCIRPKTWNIVLIINPIKKPSSNLL